MLNIGKILLDGSILSILASLLVVGSLHFNPRIFLQDYPEVIQRLVPPKTKKERKQSLVIGLPFVILLGAIPFLSTLGLMRQSGGEGTFFNSFFMLLV